MTCRIKTSSKEDKIERLRQRDGDLCFYCRRPLPFGDTFTKRGHQIMRDVTLEHLVNLRDGGTNLLHNLVLAHRACNTKRSEMSHHDKLWTVGLSLPQLKAFARATTLS